MVDRPNVLLIVLDACRKDRLSCYGHKKPTTPELEKFAKSATTFDHAIAGAPWTGASHASIFSGLYPSSHGVTGRAPSLCCDTPTLAEALSNSGYETYGFSNSPATNTEKHFNRGFDFYHDKTELPTLFGNAVEPTIDWLRFAVRYLLHDDDNSWFQTQRLKSTLSSTEEPFFAFINLNSAHLPFRPPEPEKSEFEQYFNNWEQVDLDAVKEVSGSSRGGHRYMMGDLPINESEWELIRHWYDAELAYVDKRISDLLSFLHSSELYDDTMIIVTADHGEHLGDNGLALHHFSLSETLINVPLLIDWPDEITTQVDNELVSLVDIYPTILDAVGGETRKWMEGRSLLSEPAPEAVFAEWGLPTSGLREAMHQYGEDEWFFHALQAVRTQSRKLIRSSRGTRTLYDVSDGTESEIDDSTLASELEKHFPSAFNESYIEQKKAHE